MASIREAAQNVLDVARDGIGWIVLWKEGRSWESMAFWPDYDARTGRITFSSEEELEESPFATPMSRMRITFSSEEELEELREIVRKDCSAILVNSHEHNLGVFDWKGRREELVDGLRWQYRLQEYLAADAIA